MTDAGIGQSTCVGIGGDPIIGTNFIDVLRHVQRGPGDRGDRADRRDRRRGGGDAPRRSCAREVRKPMAAFIAGRTAPPGRRMGHAGAIISGGAGHGGVEARGARGGRHRASPTRRPRSALLRDAGVG